MSIEGEEGLGMRLEAGWRQERIKCSIYFYLRSQAFLFHFSFCYSVRHPSVFLLSFLWERKAWERDFLITRGVYSKLREKCKKKAKLSYLHIHFINYESKIFL